MGVFDKFKEFVGIEDVEDDDEALEEEVKKSFVPESKPAEVKSAPVRTASAEPKQEARPAVRSSATMGNKAFTKELKLVVIEPASFDESPRLVDSLKGKRPVIINLENLETDVARKIFDFLSGATYALNGNVQKVANNIFIFAPENVDVSYNASRQTASVSEGIKSPWK